MDQKGVSRKIRVVIITGTLESSLHPVPPVADSAPEWNVFRLAEAASTDAHCSLDIHVISPCEESQLKALQDYPIKAVGKYHHVVFNQRWISWYRKCLLNSLPLHLLLHRLVKLPDLISWMYLRHVVQFLNELKPDLVVINDRPQYIVYLRNKVFKGGLLLMMRHAIGDSRRFLGLLDGIIVNSQGMKEYVGTFVEPGWPPIWQIPNTLGDEFIVPQAPTDRFTRQEKTVLFAGRLIPEKGARELLLAFRQVYEHIPHARLVFCGAGGNYRQGGELTPYELELRSLASQFPPGVVAFSGYIFNRQMGGYYCNASVAVFPSIYIESFGMVALEAMRCGTPVVASRQPGFEELVVSGTTGFLVDDPRDESALAGAILGILLDPVLAQTMGQAGYQNSFQYKPENGLLALKDIIKTWMLEV
jgi:spore coat protein SA